MDDPRIMDSNIPMSAIKIGIASPCEQKWSTFLPTPEGGFCQACSKVVVDFTKMSDSELVAFLSSRRGDTCGRMRPDQLKAYPAFQTGNRHTGLGWLTAALATVLLLSSSNTVTAQRLRGVSVNVVESRPLADHAEPQPSTTQMITGVVTSKEDGMPIPGVNIFLKGSEVGTVSNEQGAFTFPQPLRDDDVLVFSFIGLISTEYKVKTKMSGAKAIQVELALEMEYDITGKVQVDEVYTPRVPWWRRLIKI